MDAGRPSAPPRKPAAEHLFSFRENGLQIPGATRRLGIQPASVIFSHSPNADLDAAPSAVAQCRAHTSLPL